MSQWRYQPIVTAQDVERNFRSLEASLAATGSSSVSKLAADVGPTTSTALANVTGLSAAVSANTDYRFEFTVLFQVDSIGSGIKLAITAPAGASIFYAVEIPTATDSTNGDLEGQGTSSGDAVTTTATPAANTTFVARITGIARISSTAGALQVQHASSSAIQQVTTKAGSAGILTPLP